MICFKPGVRGAMTKKHKVGSDNVFADIGLRNADEHLIKARLVIGTILEERGLTQTAAAKLLGV